MSNGKVGSSTFWQLRRLRSIQVPRSLPTFFLFFSFLLVLVVSAISRSRERGRDVRASFVILIRSFFGLVFSLSLSLSLLFFPSYSCRIFHTFQRVSHHLCWDDGREGFDDAMIYARWLSPYLNRSYIPST